MSGKGFGEGLRGVSFGYAFLLSKMHCCLIFHQYIPINVDKYSSEAGLKVIGPARNTQNRT